MFHSKSDWFVNLILNLGLNSNCLTHLTETTWIHFPLKNFDYWQHTLILVLFPANEYVEETNLDGLKLNTLYGVRVAALADAAGSIGPSSKEILHRVGAVLHDNFELRPIKIEPTYAIFQWKRPSGVLVTQYKVRK